MKAALAIIAIAVILAGCTGSSSSNQMGSDFRKGTSALILSFIPNSPPSEIFDTDELFIGLEVRNKGAYGVDGKLYFSGFDKKIFGAGTKQGFSEFPFKLEGMSFYNPEGGYGVYTFSEKINPLQVTSFSPPILVTACYKYGTVASAALCMDPDPYSIAKNKACTPSDISMSGGQGGPVQVSSITVDPSKNAMRLTFNIQNSGGGMVYDKDKVAECSPSSQEGIRPEFMNKVHVESVKIGGQGTEISGNCKPGLDLRLVDGKALLMCEVKGIEGNAAYVTPLTINISYGYRSSVSRTVKIIQTPKVK